VSVVVDVGFAHVLRLGVGVRLVIVFNGRMIVFVGMGRRHVLPLVSMPEIVNYMCMFMGMNDLVMLVIHDLPLVTSCLPELALGRLPVGLVPVHRLDQPLAAGTLKPWSGRPAPACSQCSG
jgi:hypothetical protein